jgi:signal transduction histidine kinase
MSQAIHQRDVDLRREAEALEESNELLTRLNKNYLEMLSFVSHELKSPLNSMIFGTASLRDGHLGPLNEEQKKTLTTVLKNTEYLEEMVVRYLNLSRIEKGELDVHKRNVDLSRDVLAPLLPAIQAQLQAVNMNLENLVPEKFFLPADPGLLRVVLENLLSNGAKYGREGGRIEVGAVREGSETRIWVKNDGDGIPPEDLGRLFQKFVRLAGAPGHQRKGTGLGLFICREIIAKHGGRIWAESQPGKWAKFIFTLPPA